MRTTTLVTEDSGSQVVWLSELKAALGIVDDSQDERLMMELDAAISWVGDYCRRPVRRGSYRTLMDNWDRIEGLLGIRIMGYVSAVTSVEYRTSSSTYATIATSVYQSQLGQHSALVIEAPNQSWPGLGEWMDNVRVTYSAGWLHSDVPHSIRTAVTLKVAHQLDIDEDSLVAVERMLEAWRLPPW